MMAPGTESGLDLAQAIRARLRIDPTLTEERFDSTGWAYQGEPPMSVRCPDPLCNRFGLHVWRKPYETTRGIQRYWAIVCASCRKVHDLQPFDSQAKARLRTWSDQVGPGATQTPLFGRTPASTAATPNPLDDPYGFVFHVFEGLETARNDPIGRLRTLRSAWRELHDQYWNSSVDVAYGGDSSEAYLLAYLPHYLKQAEWALEQGFTRVEDPMESKTELRVGLFCCGPAPEAVALIEVLRRAKWSCRVEIHLFDLNDDGWDDVRVRLLQVGCSERWSDLEITSHNLDIREAGSCRAIHGEVAGLDLVMFQNFANEVYVDGVGVPPEVLDNLASLSAAGPPDGRFILSDKRKYKAWKALRRGLNNHPGLEPDQLQTETLLLEFPRAGSPLNGNFFGTPRLDQTGSPCHYPEDLWPTKKNKVGVSWR